WLYIGPVLRVFGPFLDPPPEQIDLARRQLLTASLRRHSFVVISRKYPLDQLALLRLPGHYGRIAAQIGDRIIPHVQPQSVGASLAFLGIGSMTLGTLIRQDRPNVVVEIDFGPRRLRREQWR